MCGIVGEVFLDGEGVVDRGRLQAANQALRHRGPDDEGTYTAPGVGLAMRRLSIIDIARGHQPMSNERGSVHVVYNGEIYNHDELRGTLEAAGYRFRTTADTEVLVHGYDAWGAEGLLARLRGMFALALWDAPRRALLVARDRMGMKPLYFVEHNGRLGFASEIRALLTLTGIDRRVDPAALALYMRIGFVSSPHTLFQRVRKLPPAHFLWLENGRLTMKEYWRLSYEPVNRAPAARIIEEFRDLLERAVRLHLMSEVPLGALLSGGVDSTTSAAFVQRALPGRLRTVTLAFPGSGLDEAAAAEASARALGTDHTTVHFTANEMADYPTVIERQEEVFARPTHAALDALFRTCRAQGLTVVITGEGADELLGGYQWHAGGRLDRIANRIPPWLRTAFSGNRSLRTAGQAARNRVRDLRRVPRGAHLRFEQAIRIGERGIAESLLLPGAHDRAGGDAIVDSWSRWLAHMDGEPEFGQRLWLQSRTRMPDYINHALDRFSMAHSVEARPPFLDHELWAFCASLPNTLKMRNGVEKYLLREAGRGIVPEAARLRPKRPLRVPFQPWIAATRLPEWAEDALSQHRLDEVGIFEPARVRALREAVTAGDPRHATLLSAVLNLQAWAAIFLRGRVSRYGDR